MTSRILFLLVLTVILAGPWSIRAESPASAPAQGDAIFPDGIRWDKKYLKDYYIYKLLLKNRFVVGNTLSNSLEPGAWNFARDIKQNVTKGDREDNLRKLLADHGDSAYAGDAALLLARAKFIYHADADGAIKELKKVAEKYPDAHWVAEDRMFTEWALIPDIKRKDPAGKEWIPRTSWFNDESPKEKAGRTWEILSYFSHLNQHPNFTVDEAHYWIAWIIIEGKIKDRYAEAEEHLNAIITKYKDEKRVQKDVAASKALNNPEILRLERTEMKSYILLLQHYEREGQNDKFLKGVADYAKMFQDHPTVKSIEDWAANKQSQNQNKK